MNKFIQHINKSRGGFGLIELVIVTAIASAALAGFLQAETLAVRLLHGEQENLEATMLAQEGMEAMRSIRDESWSANIAPLANGTVYYPVIINNKWTLSAANPGLFNGRYDRRVVFDEVLRNTSDDIAASGTADAGTRKATLTVSWGTKQIQLVSYIMNFPQQLSPPTEAKIISYEGASTDADIINFPSNDAGDGDPAQSFTTLSSAVNITRIDALLRRTTDKPSDIYAEIRTGPLGAILGTSNLITASTIVTTTPAWVEFRFVSEVPLNPSTIYYIRLRSNPVSTASASGSKGAVNWIYLQTPSSPYSGGMARRFIERFGPADTGEQLDEYDFGFRVYALQ